MQTPVQVTFHGIEQSDFIETRSRPRTSISPAGGEKGPQASTVIIVGRGSDPVGASSS